MTASTTITCTKSEFGPRLSAEFVTPAPNHAVADVVVVVDGLVRQANAHRGVFTGHSAYLDLDFTVTPDEDPRTMRDQFEAAEDLATERALITGEDAEQATYRPGDRAHFRPAPFRSPFGTNIGEGDVTVIEVVDHVTATAYSPRFTYIVQAHDGETQGTDDRELTEVDDAAAEAAKCEHCGAPDPLNLHLLGCIAEDDRCAKCDRTGRHAVNCGHVLDNIIGDAAVNASEPLTIPAVTDAQREGAYYSARRTVDQVSDRLARMMSASAPSSELNADRLEDLGAMLYAAAGHLRIAEQR